MHNLHFKVVTAESPEDAIEIAEMELNDWGGENNWFRLGGCVSQDNEVYINDMDARWTPEKTHTIDMINKQVEGWLKPDEYDKEAFVKCGKGAGSPYDWYRAKRYCEHMFQKDKHGKDTFDVLEDEFFDWRFNVCGVTHGHLSQQENDDPTNKKYVVFVDMHS